MFLISHLYGDITTTGENFLVLDVNGIGYRVSMTRKALQELSGHEGKIKIFTHLIVREDGFTLAGFLDQSELEVFLLLITVNRVGPQLALSILSQLSAEELAQALITEDEKRLTRLTGVGPRNAKRLILELKDRVKDRSGIFTTDRKGIPGQVREDVTEALIALGFPSRDSQNAVDKAAQGAGDHDPQSLLKSALAILKENRQ